MSLNISSSWSTDKARADTEAPEDQYDQFATSGVKTEETRKGRIWGGFKGYFGGYLWQSFPYKNSMKGIGKPQKYKRNLRKN